MKFNSPTGFIFLRVFASSWRKDQIGQIGMLQKLFIPFFLLLILAGCKSGELYESKDGRCQLTLYKDSSFSLKYPNFLGTTRYRGIYRKSTDSLFLKTSDGNKSYFMQADTIILNHVDPKVIRDRKMVKVK